MIYRFRISEYDMMRVVPAGVPQNMFFLAFREAMRKAGAKRITGEYDICRCEYIITIESDGPMELSQGALPERQT